MIRTPTGRRATVGCLQIVEELNPRQPERNLKVPLKQIFLVSYIRALKMMKNGVYFIVIAPLVAKLLKILIYAN